MMQKLIRVALLAWMVSDTDSMINGITAYTSEGGVGIHVWAIVLLNFRR